MSTHWRWAGKFWKLRAIGLLFDSDRPFRCQWQAFSLIETEIWDRTESFVNQKATTETSRKNEPMFVSMWSYVRFSERLFVRKAESSQMLVLRRCWFPLMTVIPLLLSWCKTVARSVLWEIELSRWMNWNPCWDWTCSATCRMIRRMRLKARWCGRIGVFVKRKPSTNYTLLHLPIEPTAAITWSEVVVAVVTVAP